MKALTLKQPWAWAICHAGKDIENRTWAPPHGMLGGRIAIHAGLGFDQQALWEILRQFNVAPEDMKLDDSYLRLYDPKLVGKVCSGAVVAMATYSGYVKPAHERQPRFGYAFTGETACYPHTSEFLQDKGKSPWFEGPYGWALRDIVVLPEPIPCKGFQKLWTLPADVEAKVLAYLDSISEDPVSFDCEWP